jgi:hypothetical protein
MKSKIKNILHLIHTGKVAEAPIFGAFNKKAERRN